MPELKTNSLVDLTEYKVNKSEDGTKGIIKGTLVKHNVLDSYGDVFTEEALAGIAKGTTIFMLHMHDWKSELGLMKLELDKEGHLIFTAELDLSKDENGNPNNPEAVRIYSLLLKGAPYQMSVGAYIKQAEYGDFETDKGTVRARLIKAIDPVEGSIVLRGAVPGATVESVKSENENKSGGNEMPVTIEEIQKAIQGTLESALKGFEAGNNEQVEKTLKEITGLKEQVTKFAGDNKDLVERLERAEKMLKDADELLKSNTPVNGVNQTIEKSNYDAYLRKEVTEGLVHKVDRNKIQVTIPEVIVGEVIKELKEASAFFMAGKIYTGSTDKIKIMVRKDRTANAVEDLKEGEGNTIEGELEYTQVEINAGVKQMRIPITDEARDDSAFDMIGEINEAISEDFAEILSIYTVKGVLNATKDQYIEGFLTDSRVTSEAIKTETGSKVTWQDMVKLETRTKKKYRKNAKYYVSNKLYEDMKFWTNEKGEPLWTTIKDGATMRFNGYDVVVDDYLDDVATGKFPAVFTDFKQAYAYFLRKDFEQEQDRKVNTRITDYYTRIRIGGKVVKPIAMKALQVS